MNSIDERFKKALYACFYSILLFAITTLITLAAYSFTKPNEYGSDATIHLIYAAAIFVFSYFSFVKLFAVYNKTAREEFVNAKEKASFAKAVLLAPYFWCDIAVLFIVLALLDLGKVYPFASGIASVYSLSENDARLYALSIMLPSAAVINLLARHGAYKVWSRTRRRKIKGITVTEDGKKSASGIGTSRLIIVPPMFSVMRVVANLHSKNNPAAQHAELPEPDYSPRGVFAAVFYKILMYVILDVFGLLVAAFALAFVGPIVALTSAALPRVFGKLIAAIIILIPFVKAFNRFNQRRKFVKKLKKLCKENKFKLGRIRSPYKFISDDSFTVTANGKTFECKTIGARKAKTPIVLDADGSLIFIRAFVFAGIRWWHYTEEFAYGFESIYKKIIIINPNAKFVYKDRDGEYAELDNGDTVGDYTVHTAGSFLNGLNRDCLDRKVRED